MSLLTCTVLVVGCASPFASFRATPQDEAPATSATSATPVVPLLDLSPSPVQLSVTTQGGVRPGERVTIRVAAATPDQADALRLAIDGTDTGWRKRDSLEDAILVYEWIASEPDTYELVGQIRTLDGDVLESRMALVVLPPGSSTIALQAQPRFPLDREEDAPQTKPDEPEPTEDRLGIWETTVTLPTYPYWEYQTEQVDERYLWPYLRFDRDAYMDDTHEARDQTYRVVVLENAHLRLSILPDLGGRLWQVEHKATGHTMFYQNPVVKPSPWGPPQQLGWLALGGVEWSAPVAEHGYDWGTSWQLATFSDESGALRAVLTTPDDERYLQIEIEITLPSDAAYFEIAPRLVNRSPARLAFDFWLNAMLAPGPGNTLSEALHFVTPGRLVQVHSRGDNRLPQAEQPLRWPYWNGRDLSRLDEWVHHLGFFEYPQAHGPFVGVYDRAADAGAVRVFPPQIARGSKVFSMGWQDAIPSRYYTDDDSTYAELHGGLSRSFFEQASLSPGQSVAWRERWYPVHGIGDLVYANEMAALNVMAGVRAVTIDIYPVQSMAGEVLLLRGSEVLARQAFKAEPDAPAHAQFDDVLLGPNLTTIRLVDEQANVLLSYSLSRN